MPGEKPKRKKLTAAQKRAKARKAYRARIAKGLADGKTLQEARGHGSGKSEKIATSFRPGKVARSIGYKPPPPRTNVTFKDSREGIASGVRFHLGDLKPGSVKEQTMLGKIRAYLRSVSKTRSVIYFRFLGYYKGYVKLDNALQSSGYFFYETLPAFARRYEEQQAKMIEGRVQYVFIGAPA